MTFPHNGQWRGALMFSLSYVWINDWVNNREAGDLRRQHGHYDVIVMTMDQCSVDYIALLNMWQQSWCCHKCDWNPPRIGDREAMKRMYDFNQWLVEEYSSTDSQRYAFVRNGLSKNSRFYQEVKLRPSEYRAGEVSRLTVSSRKAILSWEAGNQSGTRKAALGWNDGKIAATKSKWNWFYYVQTSEWVWLWSNDYFIAF